MYKELKKLSDKLKTGYEVSDKDMDSINEIADSYLNHKVKDGYNSNAYGKILAADGIKKLVSAYKNDNVAEIGNLQITDLNNAKERVKKIVENFAKDAWKMDVEKVTFNDVLKEEIKKTAKKTTSVSKNKNKGIEQSIEI